MRTAVEFRTAAAGRQGCTYLWTSSKAVVLAMPGIIVVMFLVDDGSSPWCAAVDNLLGSVWRGEPPCTAAAFELRWQTSSKTHECVMKWHIEEMEHAL